MNPKDPPKNLRRGISDIQPGETRLGEGRRHLRRFTELAAEMQMLAEDGQADAHHFGDIDLDGFWMDLKECVGGLCQQAAVLTARSSMAGSGTRDLVEEQSMESFPASDPPGSY